MTHIFCGLDTSASGMHVYKTWIEAISDNVANVSTVRRTNEAAFQERFVIAASNEYGAGPGSGAHVAGVTFGDAAGRDVHNPDHPLADAAGMVRMPDMDLADQMTSLIVAQRAYQLNVAVFERARDSYQRAIEIGRG
jgi:flagellar basal-body rod protein FlgC